MDVITKAKLASQAKHMMCNTHKTPVSMLEELAVMFRIRTYYELVETTGMDHMRTFKYRAYVDDELWAFATAGKKKDAKHVAAENLLKLFCTFADDDASHVSVSPSRASSVSSLSTATETRSLHTENSDSASCSNGMGEPQGPLGEPNYVGMLQEWCMMYGRPTPVYLEGQRGGADHQPTFTTTCNLATHQVQATAGNKKAAKKMAAQKMYCLLLQQLPQGPLGTNLIPCTPSPPSTSATASARVKVEAPSPPPPEVPSSSCSANNAPEPGATCENLCEAIQERLDSASSAGILRLKVKRKKTAQTPLTARACKKNPGRKARKK